MQDVTMIGLGEMGSALGRALVRAGHRVTLWNRTAAKADALVAAGATLASDAARAIAASPVAIVCVSDYPSTAAVLGEAGAREALKGRLLIQLTSGIPSEAREMADFVAGCGASYLDGKIFAWPRQIGTPEGAIIAAGNSYLVAKTRRVLDSLGSVSLYGEEIGAAAAFFSAGLAYLAGHWIGFAHGALICEAEGIDVRGFGEAMGSFAPGLGEDLRHMGRVVAGNAFADPESALRTAGNDIARLVKHAEDVGIDGAFPFFAGNLFAEAIAAGYGPEEHVAIIRLMRDRARRPAPS